MVAVNARALAEGLLGMVGIYRSFLRDGGDPRVFLEFPDVLLHCLHGAAGARACLRLSRSSILSVLEVI